MLSWCSHPCLRAKDPKTHKEFLEQAQATVRASVSVLYTRDAANPESQPEQVDVAFTFETRDGDTMTTWEAVDEGASTATCSSATPLVYECQVCKSSGKGGSLLKIQVCFLPWCAIMRDRADMS